MVWFSEELLLVARAISRPVEICHGDEYGVQVSKPQCCMDIPVVFSGVCGVQQHPCTPKCTAAASHDPTYASPGKHCKVATVELS
jgi:hypothetical protein